MPERPYRIGKLTRTRDDGTAYWSWCIKWADERGSHRVSLGTNDRSAAEASAREFWASRARSAVETVGEIVERYLGTQAGRKGEKRKREAWAAAMPYWHAKRPESVLPDTDDEDGDGTEYAKWRGRAANTVRNELALIRRALRWATEKNLIAAAPKIRLPAMPDSEVHHLSKAEFRRFLSGCIAPHVRLFAQLAIATGARATALLELPWFRVDFERDVINLNPPGRAQVENKGRATVPITDKLRPVLLDAREGARSPFVIEQDGERIRSIRKGFEAASKRSGVHCTPHMLRHSAAVWMAEDRTPMSEIAAYLGHRDSAITSRVYARFSPDYLRRAAKALEW